MTVAPERQMERADRERNVMRLLKADSDTHNSLPLELTMMCQGDAQCSSNPKGPNQQQPPAEPDWTPWPCPTCTVGLLLAVVVPILSLICLAMVRKACSTFEAFLADVSRNGIPRLSANSCVEHQPFCLL